MKTIIDLLENSAAKFGNNPYLLEKKTDRYESITYRETKELSYCYCSRITCPWPGEGRPRCAAVGITDRLGYKRARHPPCRSHLRASLNIAEGRLPILNSDSTIRARVG